MPGQRANRLQERFNLIRATLSEMHGENAAFCAASAAWLQAIQYTIKQAFVQLKGEGEYTVAEADAEIEALLKSFHEEMCKYLGQDQAKSIELAAISFKELLRDITHGKG